MSGSGLLRCSLTRNPISSVANPCCNRVLVGVVPALGKAMRRRDLIKGIAGSAIGWPLAALAQQSAIPVIGFLSFRSANESAGSEAAFRQGLSEIGYSEGRNVHIAFRWAEGSARVFLAIWGVG